MKDALISDICISTSAAPTYFPAHYFETKDDKGTKREFHLVDGGVAANNPVCNGANFFKKMHGSMQVFMNTTQLTLDRVMATKIKFNMYTINDKHV